MRWIVAFLFVLVAAWQVQAQAPEPKADTISMPLVWEAPERGTPLGYKLHVGTVSGVYTLVYDVGLQFTYTLHHLTPGQTYYVVATAYTTKGDSGFSNEVGFTAQQGTTVTSPPQRLTIPTERDAAVVKKPAKAPKK